MSQYKKLGKNMMWMLIGNFASKALNFLLIPLYTNYLSTQEYGDADLVYTTISLLIPILSLSIGEAVLRFALDQECNSDERRKAKVFSIGMFITILSFVILFALSPFLCMFKVLQDYYWYFVLYYISQSVYIVLAQFAKGIDNVFAFSLWGIVNTFITAILNIILIVFFSLGIEGYFIAFIVGQTVTDVGLFFHIRARRYFTRLRKDDAILIKSMLLYALPLIPNSISWWISNSSDRYMIKWFCGSAENGIYSVAAKIPAFITVIFTMFIMAWQISSVEDFGSEKSRMFYSDVNKNYMSLCLIMASLIIALIKPIARILFAKDFYVAWKAAPILILACCFHSLALFLGTIYTGAKKTNKVFISTVGAAIVNIIINFVLIPRYGIIGASIATFASYFLLWLFRVFDSRSIMIIEYGNIKLLIGCIILFFECAIVCLDWQYAKYISVIILLVICILNKEFFRTMFKMAKGVLKKRN